jgi:hypothetical protein
MLKNNKSFRNIMKKNIIYGLLAISVSNQTAINLEKPFRIEHRVINKLDGIRYAMDSLAVKNIWEVLIRIKDMLNRHHTINTVTGNISEIARLEELNSPEINNQLNLLNKKLKSEFVKATFKFIADIQASKHLIFELMKASCDHHGITQRTDLMKWAQIDDNEEHMFDITITKLSQMEVFLTDLYHFLFDLLCSCPKACNMFKKDMPKIYDNIKKHAPQEFYIFDNYCLKS